MQKMEEHLVSIITPVYNAEKFLEETILSVQNQTYQNWELLLVDDVSTDNSVEIIEKYSKEDSRIKLIKLKENSGAAVARNTAIKAAEGRFVAFLDSDDKWHNEKLEKQIEFMLQNQYAFTFTNYRIITEDSYDTGKVVKVPKEIDYEGLLKNTIIGCLTVVLDKEKIGHFEMVNIRTRQDFVLWLDILKRGYKAYGLQEELAYYRKVKGSISSNKLKAAKRNWQVYREIEKISFLRSLWYFIMYATNAIKKS
ncbi:glycosyltransferase family 2 protein [Bacillus kexueae]|uniref:glycosyltransferase family 2 protein n=1 Tax=Aeribacillus kexueae TaxID=2078952 RepID=UPI001FAE9A8F|nr:glycosyltransferase family 2 protein [Bacillus kexueae]